MNQRIRSGLIWGSLWVGIISSGMAAQAMDTTSNGGSVNEAAAFFTRVMQTSSNPIIANLARENLKKLQSGPENLLASSDMPNRSKTIAEVALLPQADNTYVVPAMVNHKTLATFLVDTGASYTVITPQLANALGVQVSDDTPMVPVTTANGTVNAPVVTLKRVSLGGMQVDNVQAVVADLGDAPQLSGLLGMSFFQGMDLSFKQDKLVISR